MKFCHGIFLQFTVQALPELQFGISIPQHLTDTSSTKLSVGARGF